VLWEKRRCQEPELKQLAPRPSVNKSGGFVASACERFYNNCNRRHSDGSATPQRKIRWRWGIGFEPCMPVSSTPSEPGTMVAISSRELDHGEQAVAEVQYHCARVRRVFCHAHVCLCCVGSAMTCCCERFMYCGVLLVKVIKQTVNTISVYSSPCYLLPSAPLCLLLLCVPFC
jgi:hypothetical protein